MLTPCGRQSTSSSFAREGHGRERGEDVCESHPLHPDTDAPFEERVVADVINVALKLENTMQPVFGLSFYAYRPRSVEACFVREVRQRWGLASLNYFLLLY